MARHKKIKSVIALWAGPLAGLSILFLTNLNPERPETSATLAVAVWMAIWWITEVLPLAVTSLLPVVLFPLLGIMNGTEVSSIYFNHVIFLFIGGFIVALAMQKWNLHRRIALKTLLITGTGQARLLLGFMLATAFLSMWISNTATTMMMVPILISVIAEVEGINPGKKARRFSVGLLLGVAYAASIGGMMTLVGTPPNLSFTRIYQIMFPEAPEISFAQWLFFAVPAGVALFLFAWLYLLLIYRNKKLKHKASHDSLVKEYQKLGKMGREEFFVLIDFVLLAVLWVTRTDLTFGRLTIPGWSNIFGNPAYINDGTVAMLMAILLFLIPAREGKKKRLMDWETARKLPWGIVLLFGGGFALAGGFKESGLSLWVGEQLQFVSGIHPILIIAVVAFSMTFLTELTSNTATTEMILPIMAGLSVAADIPPLLLMLPATLSASMAFMLPVATPPNAIIFGTDRIKVSDMAKTGLVMNLMGTIIITLTVYFLAGRVFGFQV